MTGTDPFLTAAQIILRQMVDSCVTTKDFSVEARKAYLAEVQAVLTMAHAVMAAAETVLRGPDYYK